MKKNKIVFVLVLVCVVLFITAYSILTFGKKETEEVMTDQIPLPDLEEDQKEYGSKLEALEALKEERGVSAPSIYPDHMMDDKGYFNPDYMEYEKQRIIDSIYNEGNIDYASARYRSPIGDMEQPEPQNMEEPKTIPEIGAEHTTNITELGLAHQLFFASKPKQNTFASMHLEDAIPVRVDGNQIVRDGHRLEMRLQTDTSIGGVVMKRNTPIYGFVKIRPNRVLIQIDHINNRKVTLKAHDLQDGNKGIYVENSLKGNIRDQVVNDAVGGVNIPGLPQVSGIKRLFQRDNRRIKVEIKDNYQLILKTSKK
ncbi:conjugative transposon protein TraM [Flagellimonas algicola]|uniref:Conjugative transposon protein TraM n=1 Tax=Flagellimonas algicola TaxID=2583815 RepID=A0ABY2WGT1_9FLAO|nr:conjugative transposon protein TraM [Allomuricauda algicola]TMU50779.1 conjugative transposon protein TraM [Allomuricauda algicola]